MDFKSTLLMTKTSFEMRGGLAQKEPLLVEQWKIENLYEQMSLNRKDAKQFVLHDGPPYANGNMHCGHMLNRILKDITIRFKNMMGYDTPFIFGWDTHGLPIENMVTKSGVNRKTTPIVEFRKICEAYARKQVDNQREQIRRLGVIGDFDHPYLTLNKEYEARQIEVFAKMALKGLIYKGLKPVHWSPSSESALAEAEIEYADVKSHSIYVAFPILDGKGVLDNDVRVVIWTTTPWTLPGNLAISAHPDFEYGLYETNLGKLVFLKEFEERLTDELSLTEVKLIKTIKGIELENIRAGHPFYDRESVILVGDHVTNEAGTGLVHTAPGFGAEDYVVCQKYGIKPYCPVDSKGYLSEETGERLQGLFYEDANEVVLEILKEKNALLKHSIFTHSYPHDWRTGKPLIFRATNQWFCSIEPIREQLLEKVRETTWYPAWGETRMVNMIKDRTDWCISRQRAWGVPIPIFYAEDGTPIIEEAVFNHVIELVREHGSNVWYEREAKDLLPEGYTNPHSPNGEFTKENDIMDVWFDSGSSFAGTLIERGIKYPSDLYLEGSDQYRGWFNSSLIVSLAAYGEAPYKSVVTHGFVVDENWDKMSKSKGNGIDPSKIANVYGADILRLWTATVDYNQDVRISEGIIQQVSEQYRKIRNTLKFISWNLVGFDVNNIQSEFEQEDKWILAKLEDVVNYCVGAYEKYDYSNVITCLMTFMSTDLSAFYLNIAKDTLYCDKKDSKRRLQIQTVIYKLGEALLRLLNPILPFTMDEFNKNLPGERKGNVQLLDFPEVKHEYDESLLNDYKSFLKVRSSIQKGLEAAKNAQVIRSSQDAYVELEIVSDELKNALKGISLGGLAKLVVVSEVKLVEGLDAEAIEGVKVKVDAHKGVRCDRCWNYSNDTVDLEDGSHLCLRCKEVVGE